MDRETETTTRPMSDAPTTGRPRRWWRRRRVVVPAALVGALLLAVGLWLFQPWALVLDDRVDEPVPAAVAPRVPPAAPAEAPAAPAAPSAPAPPTAARAPVPAPPAQPRVVAEGRLISHEHATSGTVRVLDLGDGSRVLRLDGLDTSNGPDLRVWVTDAPVLEGRDGWHVFDDGRYVDLGALKGNLGSSNYRLPDDLDISAYDSVSIWCDRFDVSFGAAHLRAV